MLTGFVPPSRGNALVMGRTVAHPVGMSAGICMCCRVLQCLAVSCNVMQCVAVSHPVGMSAGKVSQKNSCS